MPPIPHFVANATSLPGAGRVFLKREAYQEGKLSGITKGSLLRELPNEVRLKELGINAVFRCGPFL